MDIISYLLSRKYCDNAIVGLGAIRGANCTIDNIVHQDGINTVTFKWTGTDGTTKTRDMIVYDGTPIYVWESGNTYHYGDLAIYESQFYRCIVENSDITFDDTKWNEIGSPDGNYDLVQSKVLLPARFTAADRKLYFVIDECIFYLWDGTQWVAQTHLVQESVMPTASAKYLGRMYQYIGITDSNFTHGYVYECVSDGQTIPTFTWENVEVQPCIASHTTYDNTNSGLTANNVQDAIDETIAIKQNIMQYAVLPTASVDNLGVVYQYIGATTVDYHHGCFYECVSDGAVTPTYSWKNIGLVPTFTNTQAVWDSLTLAQQNQYIIVNITDDEEEINLGVYLRKLSTMPNAEDCPSEVVMYVGATNADYTRGYIYRSVPSVVSGETVYNWVRQDTQPSHPYVQSDYAQNDSTAIDYIKNKPTLGTASAKNFTDNVRPNSHDLVESNAVYNAISSSIASIYKPHGNLTCAQLTSDLLITANIGNVYNMTDSGTTSALFIQGAGKTINVGDTVGIIQADNSAIMFNLMGSMIDLHNYQTKELETPLTIGGTQETDVEDALEALNDVKATQFTTMPTASVDYVGAIVQYVGATTSTYTQGYWYKCVSDGAVNPTYTWEFINSSTEYSTEIATVTDLKATNLHVGDIVSTTNYAKNGDLGGATYYIREATSGETDNAGNIIILNNGLVAEMIVTDAITLSSFGVKFNNQTSDGVANSTRLQNALTYANAHRVNIVVPSGVAHFATSIICDKLERLTISSNGEGTLQYNGSGDFITINTMVDVNINHVHFYTLSTNGAALKILKASTVTTTRNTISNCLINGGYYGIYIGDDCGYMTLNNVRALGGNTNVKNITQTCGFYIGDAEYIYLDKCSSETYANSTIIEGGQYIYITECDFPNNKGIYNSENDILTDGYGVLIQNQSSHAINHIYISDCSFLRTINGIGLHAVSQNIMDVYCQNNTFTSAVCTWSNKGNIINLTAESGKGIQYCKFISNNISQYSTYLLPDTTYFTSGTCYDIEVEDNLWDKPPVLGNITYYHNSSKQWAKSVAGLNELYTLPTYQGSYSNGELTIKANGWFKWVTMNYDDCTIVDIVDGSVEKELYFTAQKPFTIHPHDNFCKNLNGDLTINAGQTLILKNVMTPNTWTAEIINTVNLGTAASKDFTTIVALNNHNLIESDAVATELTKKLDMIPELPTANADNVGKVYIYTGATTQDYIHGGIYECQEITPSTDPKTYHWQLISSADMVEFTQQELQAMW